MNPLRLRLTPLALAALIALAAPIASFAESALTDSTPEPASASEEPMASFGRLIGGEWQISILRHRFEWGIGHHTVLAKSYDQEGNLASEARWFWHPGEQAIKGYSIDASGESFAEMTTRFDGDTMINVLETINPDGTASAYTGHWVFTDSDHYDWTLYGHDADGEKTQMMQATASRESQTESAGQAPVGD